MTRMIQVSEDALNSLKAMAEQDAKDAARYRWLRDQMIAADFDYNGEGILALIFEMPNGFSASADYDTTIDAAMQTK